MNIFLLLALLTAGTEAAHAQSIAAGTISLGGNIGYSRSTNEDSQVLNGTKVTGESTETSFNLSPSMGYFLKTNFAIGVGFSYSRERRSYKQNPSQGSASNDLEPHTYIQVGPFAQYYKMLSEQFGLAGTLSAGYQTSESFSYDGNGFRPAFKSESSGYYTNLTPSIIFFPIPKFGISASLGSISYNRVRFEPVEFLNGATPPPNNFSSISSYFTAGFGFKQLLFGGTYYFGR